MGRRLTRGFSLIEILVVMGVIAILAAIAIANYLIGLQRAKQKKTMADIRTIATAWEARATEARGYNAAGQPPPVAFNVPSTSLTYAQLTAMLLPTYTKVMPRSDGWLHDFSFAIDSPLGGPPAEHYCIRSAGNDAQFQTSYVEGPTEDFDCDIVYADGRFVVYPKVR